MASGRVRLGWISAFALAACAGKRASSRPQPTAVDIVRTMAATYARATSYTDRGVRVTEFSGPQPHTVRQPFETAFIRSGGFRFEFRNGYDPKPIVVWTADGKIHRYWGPHSLEEEQNLGSATRPSDIARLLLPALAPGTGVAELQRLRIAGTEPVDGHPCWRVVGTWPRSDEYTLWIDQQTSLLRRTASQHHYPSAIDMPPFDTHETTIYEPVLNASVAASEVSGPDLTNYSPSTDPWLGVQLDGTRIARVIGGSPAEQAAMQKGDELVSLDGVAVADAASFIQRVRRKSVGESAAIVVRRNGTELAIAATVGDRVAFAMLQQQLLDHAAPPFAAPVAAGPYSARSADLAGHVTVLDFTPTSFTMCPDCGTPATYLSKLQDKYAPRGLRVIGLSTEDAAVLQRFSAEHQLHYTLAHDDGQIADAYRVYGPSTLVVIDKAGLVRFIMQGTTGLEPMVVHVLGSER